MRPRLHLPTLTKRSTRSTRGCPPPRTSSSRSASPCTASSLPRASPAGRTRHCGNRARRAETVQSAEQTEWSKPKPNGEKNELRGRAAVRRAHSNRAERLLSLQAREAVYVTSRRIIPRNRKPNGPAADSRPDAATRDPERSRRASDHAEPQAGSPSSRSDGASTQVPSPVTHPYVP